MLEFLQQNWADIVAIIISLIIGGSGGVYFVRKNIQKNKNSGTQIIGGQTVINNYGGDPVLAQQQSVESPRTAQDTISDLLANHIKNARNLLKLTDDKIQFLDTNLKKIYRRENESKEEVDKNSMTMIEGAIFAVASRNLGNKEWREHCSGSLRGLVEGFDKAESFAGALAATFDSSGTKNIRKNKEYLPSFGKVATSYSYFSETHHHNMTATTIEMQDLHGQDKKPVDNSDERFIDTAREYLDILYKLFKNIDEST